MRLHEIPATGDIAVASLVRAARPAQKVRSSFGRSGLLPPAIAIGPDESFGASKPPPAIYCVGRTADF